MSYSSFFLGGVWRLMLDLWSLVKEVLPYIGAGTLLYLLYKFLKGVARYYDFYRVERAYSKALRFLERHVECSYLLKKLPSGVIVEAVYKGGRDVSSRALTAIKRGLARLRGKQPLTVIIFGDVDYSEQVAFAIRKVFEAAFPFERVLGAEFRESSVESSAAKRRCEAWT